MRARPPPAPAVSEQLISQSESGPGEAAARGGLASEPGALVTITVIVTVTRDGAVTVHSG